MMQAQAEPLPECELLSPTGLYLITQDDRSVTSYIADVLQQKGARTALIDTDLLLVPEKLADLVAQQRQNYGPVTGIIHLAPLAAIPMPDTIADWRKYTQIHTKSLFYLLHLCAEDLQQATFNGRVLATSLLGGYFGRNCVMGDLGLPTGGSNTGLLKTLMNEWQNVRAKAVDFDTHLPPAAIAQSIIQELLLPGGRVEVGYPQGNRTVFHTVRAPVSKESKNLNAEKNPIHPSKDWVVLVTGGGRGITAAIATELIIPGMTLIVVGLSPEPTPESLATVGITDTVEIRRIFLEEARSLGLSPTPIQIERQIAKLRRDRAMTRNLEQFKQAGAVVEYLPADVRNAAEFGSLIEGIYSRYGRLDAVIHGAGIIEDKLIADKTIASFDRVFDTKVDSAFILSRHLRSESLKLLVFFSSVAGRYGNRGQSDYAAANEILNRLAWHLEGQWPNTRVVAINWGPWDTPGMASEDVKRQFRERGVIPIPLDSGCRFFTEEILYGRKGEVEPIAGEAPWESHEAEMARSQRGRGAEEQRGRGAEGQRGRGAEENYPLNSQHSALSTQHSNPFVFLIEPPQIQPNSSLTLDRTFSLTSDPYLADHFLDDKAVLPAAGAMEWMAEFVQAGWPEWTVTEVRNLRALRGLVLETEAGRNVRFRARASSHADAESLQVGAEILDPQNNSLFYRADLILRPELEEPPIAQFLPLDGGKSLDPKFAYWNYLFHGKRFQLLTAIDRVNPQGIDAWVMPSQPEAWVNRTITQSSSWLFDPGLIDVAPQLALIWTRVQRDTSALPAKLGSVVRYGKSKLTGPLHVAFRIQAQDEHTVVYDVIYLDKSGNVRLHLNNCESTCSAALNRLNEKWRIGMGKQG